MERFKPKEDTLEESYMDWHLKSDIDAYSVEI